MGRNERKIDQLLSVFVLVLYAVIIAIKWVMVYQNVPEAALRAIDIIRTIVLCLMFIVVMYNACCWTDNIILKIIFIVVTAFLIASAISVQIPSVQAFFIEHGIPLVL